MKLQHLLVVIDPKHNDQPALHRACWIAKQNGARLELLVCEFNSALDNALLLDKKRLQKAQQKLLNERLAWLEKLAAPLRGDGLQVDCQVRWGKPLYWQIIQQCLDSQPDLLLKSTHHHSLLKRIVLTSHDWQLIRHCPQPLWLVQQPEWRNDRLCVALDPLHENDKPAALDHRLIQCAQVLTQQLHLHAHYLHAYAVLPLSLAFSKTPLADYHNYVLHTEIHHRQAFEALLAHYPQITQEQTQICAGFAEEVIASYVRENGIDLLLMGAITRGQLDNHLIGQTAERVLEEVECDLLVVRPLP